MATIDFGRALRKAAKKVLSSEFSYRKEGGGFHVLVRDGESGFLNGIVLYTDRRRGGFTVELAVAPEQGHGFGYTVFTTTGMWRELGLRERMSHLTDIPEFLPYQDTLSLENQLQQALRLATVHGPPYWREATRLLREGA